MLASPPLEKLYAGFTEKRSGFNLKNEEKKLYAGFDPPNSLDAVNLVFVFVVDVVACLAPNPVQLAQPVSIRSSTAGAPATPHQSNYLDLNFCLLAW